MKPKQREGRIDEGGYRIVRAPDHPLARADGTVREHRLVLYDAIGPGKHPCHWCGWEVDWAVTYKPGGSRDEQWSALIADHLNGVRDDNRPENLVPACPYDNSHRGGMPVAGRQPSDFAGVPPWERPSFGSVGPQVGRGRRVTAQQRPAPGAVRVPDARVEDLPVDGEVEPGDDVVGSVGPRLAVGRGRLSGWRWWSVLAALPVWLIVGRWWALVVVVGWWLLVCPRVRVRPVDGSGRETRPFVSWDRLVEDLADVTSGPVAEVPEQRARRPRVEQQRPRREPVVLLPIDTPHLNEPDDPDDVVRWEQEQDVLPDLPVLGDEPTLIDDDDVFGGNVLQMRRPSTDRPVGPPPPPQRKKGR